MAKLSLWIFIIAAAGLSVAQDKAPTACEIRAYYLDKDDKPADTKDVKASVVFEKPDGKTRAYPMALAKPAEPATKAPACQYFKIEGTDYRVGVLTSCTDATPPGGIDRNKPFLKPLPVLIEPEALLKPDERSAALTKAAYFKTYLDEREIEAIRKGEYTDVYVVFTVYDKERKTKCFTCAEGAPISATSRVSADLKTLESQIESGEMEKAKVTMARIREGIAALPASAGTEKARQDCAACCKELDKAVSGGDKEKALKELRKLEAKCQDCDAAPSEKKK